MIRFGAVLAVVVIAFGLLATGFVAGSLLLVAISIGVCALALLMFLAVVVSLRHELFGPMDARPGPAARQAEPVRQAAGFAAASSAAGLARDRDNRTEAELHAAVPSARTELADARTAAPSSGRPDHAQAETARVELAKPAPAPAAAAAPASRAPGGGAPGSRAPGGAAPGGAAPGSREPGGAAPGNREPGGAAPHTAAQGSSAVAVGGEVGKDEPGSGVGKKLSWRERRAARKLAVSQRPDAVQREKVPGEKLAAQRRQDAAPPVSETEKADTRSARAAVGVDAAPASPGQLGDPEAAILPRASKANPLAPSVAKPAADGTRLDKPSVDEPSVDEPDSRKPSADRPGPQQPSVSEPRADTPSVAKPTAIRPAAGPDNDRSYRPSRLERESQRAANAKLARSGAEPSQSAEGQAVPGGSASADKIVVADKTPAAEKAGTAPKAGGSDEAVLANQAERTGDAAEPGQAEAATAPSGKSAPSGKAASPDKTDPSTSKSESVPAPAVNGGSGPPVSADAPSTPTPTPARDVSAHKTAADEPRPGDKAGPVVRSASPDENAFADKTGRADDADVHPVASTAPGVGQELASEAADGADDDMEVVVVPGITRYHRSDCLLIRFLTGDDLDVMSRRAAKDGGFVPCKACKADQKPADATVG